MKKLTLFSALLFIAALSGAQTNILPEICLSQFSSGFSQPVGVEHAGDSRLFIVEQTGKIRIVDANGKHKSHFLNISDKISTAGFEQGLLGLTFDPEYSDNGYFYIHYTNLEGNSVIARYSVNPNNPNKALPSSELIMWENDDPFRNHNSGQLAFGPDGYLYFTYALGTRGVVGRVNPEECRDGGCANADVEIVLFTELPAPLAGLTISPDMRLFVHTIYRPEIYWVQLYQ